MNEDGIIEQEMIEMCGSSDINDLLLYCRTQKSVIERLQDERMPKLKDISFMITEHDIEKFNELLETGHEFTWSNDGVVVEFVSKEHKKSELRSQIDALKDSMEHTGYGSHDLRTLASLYEQLEDLE